MFGCTVFSPKTCLPSGPHGRTVRTVHTVPSPGWRIWSRRSPSCRPPKSGPWAKAMPGTGVVRSILRRRCCVEFYDVWRVRIPCRFLRHVQEVVFIGCFIMFHPNIRDLFRCGALAPSKKRAGQEETTQKRTTRPEQPRFFFTTQDVTGPSPFTRRLVLVNRHTPSKHCTGMTQEQAARMQEIKALLEQASPRSRARAGRGL